MGTGPGWRDEFRLEHAEIDAPVGHLVLECQNQRDRAQTASYSCPGARWGGGVRTTLLLVSDILDLFLEVFYLKNSPVCFWGA